MLPIQLHPNPTTRITKALCFLPALLTAPVAAAPIAAAPVATPQIVADPSDVMNGKMPKLPSFAKLAVKPGHIRGVVKDASGKPLQGVKIYITSTAIGGASTGVSTKSDANGLYEIALPLGMCEVRGAGYALTIGNVRCALPLHPVDGEFDTFSSKKGDVENLVLLPYGIASEAGASENPEYDFYYYGGSVRIVYWTQSGKNLLPVGATIEITLKPQGKLIDGSTGRTLVIRKPVEDLDPGTFNINNIPIGVYQIEAKLRDKGQVTPLHMKDSVKRRDGLNPKEATGTATLIFSPKHADAAAPTLNVSGWQPVLIEVKREGEAAKENANEE